MTTTILHIIVLPTTVSESKTTPYQGYSREWVDEFYPILAALSMAPYDVCDPFLDKRQTLLTRALGTSMYVYMIREDLLDGVHLPLDHEFVFLWSSASTFKRANNVREKFKYDPCHFSITGELDSMRLQDMTHSAVKEMVKARIELVMENHPNEEFKDGLRNVICRDVDFLEESLNDTCLAHNCTAPMIRGLESLGFVFDNVEAIEPSGVTDQHVSAMIGLTHVIDSLREEARADRKLPKDIWKYDSIIHCPSIYAFLYNANSNYWNEILKLLQPQARSILKKLFIRNKGYSNAETDLQGTPEALMEDELFRALIFERAKELSVYTNVISVLAASQFCPTIRLPNSVMLHRDILKDIEKLVVGNSKKRRKSLNKIFRRYSKTLLQEIGSSIVELGIQGREKILAICDFPLEWFTPDLVPLMFTHQLSRVPSTPGNLMSQMCLSGQTIMIPQEFFYNILIIRSFKFDDPIRNFLQVAIDTFHVQGCYKNLTINIIDVDSSAELVTALNDFSGYIVIFDCHGGHGGEKENAYLHIGDEKFDVWELGKTCRVPPIIILSACSTQPVNGSHASVANGFFRYGVMSIIGTHAPISADHAGLFVARILYRIAEFVPLRASGGTVSWREVISLFFRMSYATDILRGLMKQEKILSVEDYKAVHLRVNISINSGSTDWFDTMIKDISEVTDCSRQNILGLIDSNYRFVETMLYTHLGRPENIMISGNDRE
jgi:hypothetical protein